MILDYQHQLLRMTKELTQQDLKLLDRQRFIGLETQKRLLNSLVLVTPLNGPNAEFAKNLVLSRVTIAVYDPAPITDLDFECNFLVARDSVGKNRGATLLAKLSQMNESANHELISEDISLKDAEYFSRFTLICTSTTSFAEMRRWDSICRAINRPYFNMVPCGLYAFAYISLGDKYTYIAPNADSREINYGPDNKPVNKFINYDEVVMSSLPLQETLEPKAFQKKEVYHAILMMHAAEERGLKFDPFHPDDTILQQILEYPTNNRPEKSWPLHTKFARTFGVEFCPVYSVLGSVLSQQVIKIVSGRDLPAVNWFYYDSESSTGQILQLQTQNKERETRRERPDLREATQTRK